MSKKTIAMQPSKLVIIFISLLMANGTIVFKPGLSDFRLINSTDSSSNPG